jgi:hypothetical protein
MKAIYTNEIKRAFNTIGMKLALLVGCALSVWHVITVIMPISEGQNYELSANAIDDLYVPISLFSTWMGNELFPIQSYIFYLILPLLAVLPFGSSFFEDIKSGYIINVCTRVEKKIYFKAKYLAVFLSGGVTVVAPLLLNLVLSSMFMPAFIPDNGTVGTISPTTMAYEVFFTHPLVYVLMFIVIDFLFAGVIATLALSYTYFTEHRFGVMIVPFVFYFFIYSLTNLIDKTDYSLFFMLNGGANNNYLPVYTLYFLLFFILSYVIFMWKGKKQDVKA